MKKIFLIIFILLSGIHISYSQTTVLDQIITINAKNSDTKDIFHQISLKTGYFFTYPPDIISADKNITHKFIKQSVREILDFILINKKLNYKIVEDHILICKNEDHQLIISNNENETNQYIIIEGIVKEDKTEIPLSYVSVGIVNTGTGTVTNQNGEFSLKIPQSYIDSVLFVGHIGYTVELIPVNKIKFQFVKINLKEEFISIHEVIVKNNDPVILIKKALENVALNYPQNTYYLKAFYREGVFKRNEIVSFSEAVLDIVKTPYKNNIVSDKIFVDKSRKIVNTSQIDTVFVKLKDGLYTSLKLDFVKNPLDFFTEAYIENYRFATVDIITYLDRPVYVIEFEQKETVADALYKGKLFIDTEWYAVIGAEFEINFNYNTDHLMLVTAKSKGFSSKPLSVKYSVTYRKPDDKYILSRVSADLLIKIRKKRDLFSSEFHTFFEMVIVDAVIKNDENFSKDKLAQRNKIFIDNNYTYDELFWGKDNYIKPEKEIEEALKDINAKLQITK